MITHLRLKSGSSPGQSSLTIEIQPSITIFVGPNNSGKSLALQELFQFCTSGQVNANAHIVERLVFANQDKETALEAFEAAKVAPFPRETVAEGSSIIMVGATRIHVQDARYLRTREFPNERTDWFAKWHLQHLTLNLDGPSRIGLVNPQGRGDLRNPTQPLARLLTNDAKREALRATIHEAVGLYFAIDAQVGDQLNIRFGQTPPPDERSFNDAALDYLREARGIDLVSDGVKAFTGILLQVSAGDPQIIIVDEPEAFLHPSLASKLGSELAKGAANEGKYIFASTHNPQFVMGAILSGASVNIVRLTYTTNVGTARLLPSSELTTLMQDPLLRSVGLLSALFYDHVIVGEADADRAFYQELNERLLAANDGRGVPHTLFLNAQGKDTIPKIVEPLRRLGIPTAAIVDIDVLKEGGQKWTRHLRACGIPDNEHQPYGTRRANVLATLQAENAEFKREGGVSLLKGQAKEAAENLFSDLARYGLFVVQRGEVEAWLSELDVPRSKEGWLRSIFEKMGSDPGVESYVRPGPDDVWDFIGEIRKWLVDTDRRGIPD
jgi:ABC-type cobalamin/Fe3+-siderophores transport system ATPase subunit